MAGTRAAVALAALIATLLLMSACGGGNDASEGSPRLTLADDECTYEGDQSPPRPTFEAEAVNESSKLGAFEIAVIGPGGTFADVEAYVEAQRQRLEDGLEIEPVPAYMIQGARAQVSAGESGMLVSTITPGEWVLWCAHDHPPTAVFLIPSPLEVSD